MLRVVPDASVLLKWVLPPQFEEHVEQALVLRSAIAQRRVNAIVPALWYFEKYLQTVAGEGHVMHLKDWR